MTNLELNKPCSFENEMNKLQHENAILKLQLHNAKLQGELELSNLKTKYNSIVAIVNRSLLEDARETEFAPSYRIVKNAMRAIQDITK